MIPSSSETLRRTRSLPCLCLPILIPKPVDLLPGECPLFVYMRICQRGQDCHVFTACVHAYAHEGIFLCFAGLKLSPCVIGEIVFNILRLLIGSALCSLTVPLTSITTHLLLSVRLCSSRSFFLTEILRKLLRYCCLSCSLAWRFVSKCCRVSIYSKPQSLQLDRSVFCQRGRTVILQVI